MANPNIVSVSSIYANTVMDADVAASAVSLLTCGPNKVQKIIKLYNLQNLDTEHPKTLGNTGIVIFFNPSMNRYCLKK